jgi:hypothetical protein
MYGFDVLLLQLGGLPLGAHAGYSGFGESARFDSHPAAAGCRFREGDGRGSCLGSSPRGGYDIAIEAWLRKRTERR